MSFSEFDGSMDRGLAYYRMLKDRDFALRRVARRIRGQDEAVKLVYEVLGDSASRLDIVRALEELACEGKLLDYPTEDKFRIAEAYFQKYCPREEESPEVQLARNIGER